VNQANNLTNPYQTKTITNINYRIKKILTLKINKTIMINSIT